jgi:hypothetical protein
MTSPSRLWVFVAFVSLIGLASCSSGTHSKDAAIDRPPSADGVTLHEAGSDVGGADGGDGGLDGSTPMGFNDGSVGVGGACQVNADCANSPAATALANVRCAGGELYCWNGECYSECTQTCTVVRSDVNPCPAPRICEARFGGQESFCAMTPAKCRSASDCPAYLPRVDGGQAAWSCQDGGCTYPGYQFPTR